MLATHGQTASTTPSHTAAARKARVRHMATTMRAHVAESGACTEASLSQAGFTGHEIKHLADEARELIAAWDRDALPDEAQAPGKAVAARRRATRRS